MKKYQEALDIVARYCSDSKHGIRRFELSNELETLKELVDRATPMKPIVKNMKLYCPRCGARLQSHKGCSNNDCRQAIDLGNEPVKKELVSELINPLWGDLFTLEQFKEDVASHCLTDYDGWGYYSDGIVYYKDLIVNLRKINNKYSHVVWCNK